MTLELYPASAHNAFHGTALQYPHHIDEAVQQIHGACQGLGTDEKTLISVLGSKSPETRNLIALRYKELYRQPLKSLLKSETSGDFGRLLRMISTPLPETEAQILRDATQGMGTTESLIVQFLSGRSNDEMNILKRTYFDLVGKDLAVTLNSELSGDFRKVVMAVLQSSQVPYNPAVHNAAKAEEEATALYKAGQGRLGTNEEVFIGILVKAPPEFLKMMDSVYVAKYNNNIAKAVDKEFSGDAKKSLNYIVRSTIDPYPAIAEVFEKTMKGFGTDETGLSTALVRYQSVLPYVKAAYKKLYHEELRDRISGETSGDYKRLLLEVFDAPQDLPRSKGVGSSGVGISAASSPAYLSTQTSYMASRPKPFRPNQPMALPLNTHRRHSQRRVIHRRVEAATRVKLLLKVRGRHQAILLRNSSLGILRSSKQVTLPLNSNHNRVTLDNSSNRDIRSRGTQDKNSNSSNRDILDNTNQRDTLGNNYNNRDTRSQHNHIRRNNRATHPSNRDTHPNISLTFRLNLDIPNSRPIIHHSNRDTSSKATRRNKATHSNLLTRQANRTSNIQLPDNRCSLVTPQASRTRSTRQPDSQDTLRRTEPHLPRVTTTHPRVAIHLHISRSIPHLVGFLRTGHVGDCTCM
ncbi:hypothetical protein PF006_g6991 [Phytophthora fragariae]|uniref:Annexin n=1 Tax=Phytophthora fragariae TaxID=53985 RepID=A0A6A3UAU9_9STRA|nr:hypothetical protein PF006_g6991 [Phytophthora fragariae]